MLLLITICYNVILLFLSSDIEVTDDSKSNSVKGNPSIEIRIQAVFMNGNTRSDSSYSRMVIFTCTLVLHTQPAKPTSKFATVHFRYEPSKFFLPLLLVNSVELFLPLTGFAAEHRSCSSTPVMPSCIMLHSPAQIGRASCRERV